MRLTDEQVKLIKDSVVRFFGEKSKVYLFGSRVDDTAKGGDIDLCIEADFTSEELFLKKINMLSELQLKLGERKIDVVTFNRSSGGVSSPLVIQEALSNGVEL